MIKTSFILSICKAFPKAEISEPFEQSSYLFDMKGNVIGHFSYASSTFYLYEGYKYFKEAKHTLTKNKVQFEVRKPDTAALLYSKP